MLSIDVNCDYVMFGSFQSRANHLKITHKHIHISAVSEHRVDYTVLMAFEDIVELKFCRHFSISGICLKADTQAYDEITKQLFRHNESINSFKFNVNSADISDHYIIAVLSEQLTQEVVTYIQLLSSDYSHINCHEISCDDVKDSLKQIMNRIKDTLVMTHVVPEEEDKSDTDKVVPQESDDCLDIESKETQSVATLCDNPTTSETMVEFCCQPMDIMFGTFEVSVNELVFTLDFIKFVDISKGANGSNSALKQHFMISYDFVEEITYNFQIPVISVIIRISDGFCQAVEHFLKIGNNEDKRAFNVHSTDLRENYLIIRFESELSQIFWNFLNGIRNRNQNICLNERNDKIIALLCESTKSQIQLISKNSLENQVMELSTECNGLKRKCDELEDNELFCAICLEKRSSLMAREEKFVSTICGHVFCKQCLNNSLKVRTMCPICRNYLKPPKGRVNPVFHELHI